MRECVVERVKEEERLLRKEKGEGLSNEEEGESVCLGQ